MFLDLHATGAIIELIAASAQLISDQDPEKAVAWLGFVLHHPSKNVDVAAGVPLQQVQRNLSKPKFDDMFQRGQSLKLDDVIQALQEVLQLKM